jgi:hypothetical protein
VRRVRDREEDLPLRGVEDEERDDGVGPGEGVRDPVLEEDREGRRQAGDDRRQVGEGDGVPARRPLDRDHERQSDPHAMRAVLPVEHCPQRPRPEERVQEVPLVPHEDVDGVAMDEEEEAREQRDGEHREHERDAALAWRRWLVAVHG